MWDFFLVGWKEYSAGCNDIYIAITKGAELNVVVINDIVCKQGYVVCKLG